MGVDDQLQQELQAQQQAITDLLRQVVDLDPTARAVLERPSPLHNWEVARSTALDVLAQAEGHIESARQCVLCADSKAFAHHRRAGEKIDLARQIVTLLQQGQGQGPSQGEVAAP